MSSELLNAKTKEFNSNKPSRKAKHISSTKITIQRVSQNACASSKVKPQLGT